MEECLVRGSRLLVADAVKFKRIDDSARVGGDARVGVGAWVGGGSFLTAEDSLGSGTLVIVVVVVDRDRVLGCLVVLGAMVIYFQHQN